MSILNTKALCCDDCSEWADFGLVEQPATALELRTAAAAAGWEKAGKRDICVTCRDKPASEGPKP